MINCSAGSYIGSVFEDVNCEHKNSSNEINKPTFVSPKKMRAFIFCFILGIYCFNMPS